MARFLVQTIPKGGGQYQALPKGMLPTTVKVNADVDREASLDV